MTILIQDFLKRDYLIPLCELSVNDRRLVFERSVLKEIEPRTLMTPEKNSMMYLLEGEVNMLSAGFVTESFMHLDNRALKELFSDDLDEDSVLFSSHGVVLQIDKEFFNGLYLQSQANSIVLSDTELSQSEEMIFQQLLIAFKNKTLTLPMLPEAALKIRQAVNASDVGSQDIIDIVQTDALLTARLLKVSNSPLYGTWRAVKTIKDAVRRLGVEASRNLSISLSIHQLYQAKTSLIKNEMLGLYAETRRISALAFMLTKDFCDELDPEQSMLAGLLQGVGVLPILMHIDKYPHLAQSHAQLNKSIKKLKVQISILLFSEWHFPPHFIEYVEHAENWTRDTVDIDYCDVLIAARLLFLCEHNESDVELPDLYELPIFKKLKLFEHYDRIEDYLKHSHEDVSSMNRLLG